MLALVPHVVQVHRVDTTTAHGKLVFGTFALMGRIRSRADQRTHPSRTDRRPSPRPPRRALQPAVHVEGGAVAELKLLNLAPELSWEPRPAGWPTGSTASSPR